MKPETLGIEQLTTAHYEEYKVLTQEIQQRVERQEQLTHLSIILSGVMITAYGLALDKPTISLVLLIFPVIYCLVIWLILRHDVMLQTIVIYIFSNLRPKVNRLLGLSGSSSVWLWEAFRYNRHLKSGRGQALLNRFLAFVRYGIPLLLSIISIILYIHIKRSNDLVFAGVDGIVIFLDVLVILFTLYLMIYWVSQPVNLIIPD